MDCRIIAVEQGSEEWLELRRNRITCSRLADVMSNPVKCKPCGGTGTVDDKACADCDGKGKVLTKRFKQYRQEKVLELLGYKNVEDRPEWAAHGTENEPRAIAGYEWKYGVDVEHDVFLVSDKYDWLGGSPDLLHLPDYSDGGEIKCRQLFKNYRKYRNLAELHKGTIRACPPENRHQVQGHMMLTGFNRWWMVQYYIGDDLEGGVTQKIHRVAIPRDDALIEKMEVRCLEFITECYKRAGLA